MQDAANKMCQTGEILPSAGRGRSDAFDRANKGFGYYLRSAEILEHSPSRARGDFRSGLRRRLSEGRPYEVPPGATEPVPYVGLDGACALRSTPPSAFLGSRRSARRLPEAPEPQRPTGRERRYLVL
jgi:hypothetical protein